VNLCKEIDMNEPFRVLGNCFEILNFAIGCHEKKDLFEVCLSTRGKVTGWGKSLLYSSDFMVKQENKNLNTVVLNPSQLGLHKEFIQEEDLVNKAASFGLMKCPVETGPYVHHLNLLLKKNDWITILSDSILSTKGRKSLFRIGTFNGRRQLTSRLNENKIFNRKEKIMFTVA